MDVHWLSMTKRSNKKQSKISSDKVAVTIELSRPEYKWGSRLAKEIGLSPERFFSERSTESFVPDLEDHYGVNSRAYKSALVELGIRQ